MILLSNTEFDCFIIRKEKENSSLNQTVTSLKSVEEDNQRLYTQIETLVDDGFDA